MTCDDVQKKLDPYVDAELAGDELAVLETHLRGCAACAAAALGRMKLKRMTGTVLRYAPSREFRQRIEDSVRPTRKPAWTYVWLRGLGVAAVTAAVLFAAVVLWVGHSNRQQAIAELADLHVTTLASPNPVDVRSTDRHTVKPWFAGRIPFSFNLPELQNSDFSLAGGRVCYFHHAPGAQLIFHIRRHQISVFIFQEQPNQIPFFAESTDTSQLGFQVRSWSEGGLRYFIVGDAPASDLRALGDLLKSAARG